MNTIRTRSHELNVVQLRPYGPLHWAPWPCLAGGWQTACGRFFVVNHRWGPPEIDRHNHLSERVCKTCADIWWNAGGSKSGCGYCYDAYHAVRKRAPRA